MGFCDKLFSKFTTTLSLSDPSLRPTRRAEGLSIGDDICGFLKVEAKLLSLVQRRVRSFQPDWRLGCFPVPVEVRRRGILLARLMGRRFAVLLASTYLARRTARLGDRKLA